MICRKRHENLDERVKAAEKERRLSRRRLNYFREHVFRPLAEAGEHNGFAEIIRNSLIEGHDR